MKCKVRKILTLVPVLFFLILINETSAQEIKFKKLTVEQGLSNSFVNCLLQDRTGFIWFGTDDGLNRFDGYEIKVYRNNPDDKSSISGNIIWALCEDISGKLWIGTKSEGLNKYDPITDEFEYWDLDSSSTEEINITYIYEDSKNNIWVGTYKNGLYRYNTAMNKFDHWQNELTGSKILSDNFVTSIIEDHKSNIWIATYNGLNKFNPNQPEKPFTKFLTDSKDPIWYLSESSFFEGTIWMGTLNGLLKFDPINELFSETTLPENYDLQFSSSVSSVAEEEHAGENILWVGTFGGLVKLNLTTGYKERFIQSKKSESELLSNQIHDIILDKSGVVWIASENGLNFYSSKRSKFNLRTQAISFLEVVPALFKNNIRAITQTEDESLWFGTDAGLLGIKKTASKSSIINNSELNSLNVWSLFSGSSDKLWIGTYGQGLKEFNIRTNNIKSWTVNNPDFNIASFAYVKTILEDNDGKIWMGFWGAGLARLNPVTKKVDHWRNEKNNPSSLSYNDVWVLFKDRKERIWIGTNGGGLNLYTGEAHNYFKNWSSNKEVEQSLSSNSIYTICESVRGNKSDEKTILWIGTANGLNKFVVKNDSDYRDPSKLNVEINYYTVEDGLPDNAIESILEDENGNLWIGTSSGISFFNIKDEHFSNYTTADGLSGSSFNSSAAFKTSNGTILFGCTNGLNFFDPERIKQSTFSPPVIITDFQILNQPAGIKNKSALRTSIYNSKETELSYNQNDLAFEFAALDYNAPEIIEYAYFLEGLDREWIYSGSRRFVTYANLDPGKYVLQVKATNSDGLWNEQIAKIFIVINPPFWSTWWAYTLYVIAFIGGLAFIRATEIKRREKKQEEKLRRQREAALLREAELKAVNLEQEKEIEKHKIRNRIAQDLHDEIGSNLSSISLMSELIQNDDRINAEASEKIKRIHKVAKGSTQAMRDIVWLTNPSSDSLKDLIAKMKEVADDMLGKLNLHFEYPKEFSDIQLLPESKRNIFFIYKETLNNIVKHAESKSVEIKIRFESNTIFLSIKDDGKGFNTETGYGGNGLKNISSRVKEINGNLKFVSSPGNGTLLELTANITQMRD